MTKLAEYTEKLGNHPGSVRISQHVNNISIAVRAPVKCSSGGEIEQGEFCEIVMTPEDFEEFLKDVVRNFKPKNHDPNQHKFGFFDT